MEARSIKQCQGQYSGKYIKVLIAELLALEKGILPARNALYLMDGDNVFEWYVLAFNVGGDKDEFVHGEYLIKLSIDKEKGVAYPPKFMFLTPNGIYNKEARPCISMGEYHASNFKPAEYGIVGFAAMVIEGMRSYAQMGFGINIIKSTIAEKKRLALKSREYNAKHHGALIDRFIAHIVEYKLWQFPGLEHYKDVECRKSLLDMAEALAEEAEEAEPDANADAANAEEVKAEAVEAVEDEQ